MRKIFTALLSFSLLFSQYQYNIVAEGEEADTESIQENETISDDGEEITDENDTPVDSDAAQPEEDNVSYEVPSIEVTEEEQTVEIVFDANGGVFSDASTEYSATISSGNIITSVPQPYLEGADFAGWSRNVEGNDLIDLASTPFFEETRIYAVWTINESGSIQNETYFSDAWKGVSVSDVKVTPYSNSAVIEGTVSPFQLNIIVIASTDPDDLKTIGYDFSIGDIYRLKHAWAKSQNYQSGIFTVELPDTDALEPETTYWYQFVYENYESDGTEWRDHCYVISEPESFTTKAALEKSEISIGDISVDDVGYFAASVRFTVNNPQYEPISGIWVSANDTFDSYAYTEKEIATCVVPLMNDINTITAYVTTVSGERAESETITIEPLDRKNLVYQLSDVEVTTTSISRSIELNLEKTIDKEQVSLAAHYRKKGEDTYNTTWGGYNSVVISDLEPNSEYEVYYDLCLVQNGENISVEGMGEEYAETIKTNADTILPETDFDANLFKYLINTYDSDGDGKLRASELSGITNLYINADDGISIKSLKGIRHLPSLIYIDIEDVSLEDISELVNFKRLEQLDLSNNKISTIPDLSSLNELRWIALEGNRLTEDGLKLEYVPSKVYETYSSPYEWLKYVLSTQILNDIKASSLSKYYRIGDDWPVFILLTENSTGSDDYTVEVTVNNKTITRTQYISYGSFISLDHFASELGIGAGTYSAKVVIRRGADSNSPVVYEGTLTITLSDELDGYMEDISFLSSAEYKNINGLEIFVPFSNGMSFTEMSLIDSAGNKVAECATEDLHVSSSAYNDVYASELNGRNVYYDNIRIPTLYGFFRFTRPLSPGDYSVRVVLDGKTYTFKDKVHVLSGDKSVITGVTTYAPTSQRFDQSGDYVFVYVQGKNIDTTKVWPVLKSGKNEITSDAECIYSIDYEGNPGYVYRLKKSNSIWNMSDYLNCDYEFQTKDGYSFLDAADHNSLYISLNKVSVYEFYYNRNDQELDVTVHGATSGVLTVNIYDPVESNKVIAKGELVLSRDDLWTGELYDLEGFKWIPENYINYHLTGTLFTGGISTNYSDYFFTNWIESDYVRNEADFYIAEQTSFTKSLTVVPIGIIEFDPSNMNRKLSASILDINGNELGNVKQLNAKGYDGEGYDKHVRYSGEIKLNSPITNDGRYVIRIYENNKEIYEYDIFVVVSGTFCLSGQETRLSNGKLTVMLFSPEIDEAVQSGKTADQLWNTGYSLEVYDSEKQRLNNIKITSKNLSEYLSLEVTGIPENQSTIYVRLLKNGKTPMYIFNPEISYYEATYGSDTYGKQVSSSRSINFTFDDSWSFITGVYTENFKKTSFPIRISLYEYGTFNLIKTIQLNESDMEVSSADMGNFRYGFTETDLKGLDTSKRYNIQLNSNDGFSVMTNGYVGAEGSAVRVNGISLSEKELLVAQGTSAALTETVLPANASQKIVLWSSSNTDVATVTSAGKITGISLGEAVITAKTMDGHYTAECKVKVVKANYSLTVNSNSNINVAGSGEYKAGETVTLTAPAPEAGYKFARWKTITDLEFLNSTTLRDQAISFKMPIDDVTITAVYVDEDAQGSIELAVESFGSNRVNVVALYDAYLADEDITKDIKAGGKEADALFDYDSEEKYIQTWKADNLATGTYKLAVYKEGYLVKIEEVDVDGSEQSHEVKLRMLGDINNDGRIGGMDVVLMRQLNLKRVPSSLKEEDIKAAD
ncbi:MAG: Ig-like domain-containing protein, partial [Solobacterium sp.]|nr:Ig-like domain-containing protein [Solobacterium sp.]